MFDETGFIGKWLNKKVGVLDNKCAALEAEIEREKAAYSIDRNCGGGKKLMVLMRIVQDWKALGYLGLQI